VSAALGFAIGAVVWCVACALICVLMARWTRYCECPPLPGVDEWGYPYPPPMTLVDDAGREVCPDCGDVRRPKR
jgi:hypothetical protein